MLHIRSMHTSLWFLRSYTFLIPYLHATGELFGAMAAHNWAILLLSRGSMWETGGRWRKTWAWLWRQTGTICCTYPQAHTLHSPRTPSSSQLPAVVIFSCPSGCGTHRHQPIAGVTIGLVSSLLPDEWLNTYRAYQHSQWDPASQPWDMCSFSAAGTHLPLAPLLKLICHIYEARRLSCWVPPSFELADLDTYRKERVKKWHNLTCIWTASLCAIVCCSWQ